MTTSALCLLAYLGWTVLLTFVLLGVRGMAISNQGRELNSFAADGSDMDALGQRVTRAFSNTQEWLVIPASLLLLAIATDNTAVTDGLAPIAVLARIVQSVAHMVSTSNPAVMVRATGLTVQLVIWIYWAVSLAG